VANEERRSSDRRVGHSIEQAGKIWKCRAAVYKKNGPFFASRPPRCGQLKKGAETQARPRPEEVEPIAGSSFDRSTRENKVYRRSNKNWISKRLHEECERSES
jgi:hypothetical protein